jgi:hypothetical protein
MVLRHLEVIPPGAWPAHRQSSLPSLQKAMRDRSRVGIDRGAVANRFEPRRRPGFPPVPIAAPPAHGRIERPRRRSPDQMFALRRLDAAGGRSRRDSPATVHTHWGFTERQAGYPTSSPTSGGCLSWGMGVPWPERRARWSARCSRAFHAALNCRRSFGNKRVFPARWRGRGSRARWPVRSAERLGPLTDGIKLRRGDPVQAVGCASTPRLTRSGDAGAERDPVEAPLVHSPQLPL